jgi:hypothetical protein
MENKHTKKMTLGDLITAANRVWGSGYAKQMARLAINSRWVLVHDPSPFLISAAKGKTI